MSTQTGVSAPSWRADAADLIPCEVDCPSREGIRAHSDDCRDQRDVALAFFAKLVTRAQAAAWQQGHAAGVDYQGDGWNADVHDPADDNPYGADAEVSRA